MTDTSTLADVIAGNIRRLRERAGMSQRALARAAGVSSPAVSGWEDGAASITAGHLLAVADVLGVSATRLLGRDNTGAFWDGYAAGWDACRARMNTATDPAPATRDGAS